MIQHGNFGVKLSYHIKILIVLRQYLQIEHFVLDFNLFTHIKKFPFYIYMNTEQFSFLN